MRHLLNFSFGLAYHYLTTEDIERGLTQDFEVETKKIWFEYKGTWIICHF